MPRLSKSRFIAGWQCPLRLWYTVHEPWRATPPDPQLQAIFDQGHRLGQLAQQRYPSGVLVEADYRHTRQALEQTQVLMADPGVPAIFEAALEHDQVLTRVDALVRNGDGWDLVEVKGATRAKEVFQLDVAIQYWILTGAGIPVRDAGLLLIDRDYVYPGGAHDPQEFFRFEPLTRTCEHWLEWIEAQAVSFQEVAARTTPPQIEIGQQCFSPYPCPFYNHCSADREWPEHPIEELPYLAGERYQGLLERGVTTIDAIPDDYPLTVAQKRIRDAVAKGHPWTDPDLGEAVQGVEWPLFFLDFETAQPALPRYPGTSPFQALPFQFSCHIQRAPGVAPEHTDFLATADTDPRRPLAEALLNALGDRGSIVVYSSFERRVLGELADALPDLAEPLAALQERLWDLLRVLRNHYYHPAFKGSYSIKRVLPVLVQDLDYTALEVADGQAAAQAWIQMLDTDCDEERDRLAQALREYCFTDTLAMVRLREALLRAAGEL